MQLEPTPWFVVGFASVVIKLFLGQLENITAAVTTAKMRQAVTRTGTKRLVSRFWHKIRSQ